MAGRSSGTGRLEAFSDGVMAIAITLLILDVKVPIAEEGRLAHDLAHQWPSYAAYVVTFLVIGIMWVNHHVLFDRAATVTRTVFYLNIFLLMGVAFLPFPTALLAEYLREAQNSHIAAAVYSVTMTFIGTMFVLIWAYFLRHPELRTETMSEHDVRTSLRRSMVGPVIYGATIALAFVSAYACLVVYFVMAVYFMVWRPRLTPAETVPADQASAA